MLVVYIELNSYTRACFQRTPLSNAPPAYQPRLRRKKHPNAYVETVAGLWLVEQAMNLTGRDSNIIANIDFDADGRPHIAGGPVFSVSHSHDYVACAMTCDGDPAWRVGLDIEQPRPIPAARLARLASNDDERTLIEQDPDCFFDYWCAREATVKATGRVGLKRIRQIRLAGDQAWLDNECWTLYPLDLSPGMTACMACDSPNETAHIRCLTPHV